MDLNKHRQIRLQVFMFPKIVVCSLDELAPPHPVVVLGLLSLGGLDNFAKMSFGSNCWFILEDPGFLSQGPSNVRELKKYFFKRLVRQGAFTPFVGRSFAKVVLG